MDTLLNLASPYGPSVPVALAFARAPPCSIVARDDAVHAVGCEEPIFDALFEAVLVDGFPEVAVGCLVFVAQGRCGHTELEGRLEALEDLAPIALALGTPAVAFVDDDEVEKVGRVFPVESGTALVFGDDLVDGEVHLPSLVDLTVLDFPAGIPERCEHLVLGFVHQNVAVGQVQDLRTPVFSGTVPASAPELPADLEGNDRLAGSGGHRQETASLPFQDRIHGAVDGDLLVVAQPRATEQVRGGQEPFGRLVVQGLAGLKARPEFVGLGERVELFLLTGEVVVLDNTVAVGRVGEFEIEYLGVLFCLLEAGARGLVDGFRLDYGDRHVRGVAEQAVGTLLGASSGSAPDRDHASVCERPLLRKRVWLVVPPCFEEPREDVLPAGVGLGDHGTLINTQAL